MRIATWNIASGVDMNNYKGEYFDKESEFNADDKIMIGIANSIKSNNVDVVAFQEIITTKSFGYIEKLSKLTGLKYYIDFANSPNNLVKNTEFGIAVLSRYPIECKRMELFTNPNLIKTTEKGSYSSHDKGFLAVKIQSEPEVGLVCSHFLPFKRFGADAFDYKQIFERFENYIKANSSIVCADFNVIEGREKLVLLLSKLAKTHNFVFDEITTTDNKKCDNILLPKSIEVKNSWVEKNGAPSDHYMCIVEI